MKHKPGQLVYYGIYLGYVASKKEYLVGSISVEGIAEDILRKVYIFCRKKIYYVNEDDLTEERNPDIMMTDIDYELLDEQTNSEQR